MAVLPPITFYKRTFLETTKPPIWRLCRLFLLYFFAKLFHLLVPSRKTDGKTLVSSQSLLSANTKEAEYKGDMAYNLSRSSYGNGIEAFRVPDGDSAGSTGGGNAGGGDNGGGGNDTL